MREYYPQYYSQFECIADKCKHNCCIGWEIDIDEDTMEKYRKILGNDICNIEENEEGISHFVLRDCQRCSFLNKNNLCEIILKHGKENLCNICADHPRYINHFSSRVEYGLGLCCEEACRLILTYPKKVKLICRGEENISLNEGDFFNLRKRVLDIAQNRSLSYGEREKALMGEFDITLPENGEIKSFYSDLECMDDEWMNLLDKIDILKAYKGMDICLEQLLVYFLLRHLAGSEDDGLFKERLAFSILSVKIIWGIYNVNEPFERFLDIARMYSAEIEYSDENPYEILMWI